MAEVTKPSSSMRGLVRRERGGWIWSLHRFVVKVVVAERTKDYLL